MFRPKWDGAVWLWYTDPLFETEVPKPTKATCIRSVAGGYTVQGFFYNDDGSSPDPRPGKNVVTRRLVIQGTTTVGRPIQPSEVKADVDYWVSQQRDAIVAAVARVTRKPEDFSKHAGVKGLRIANDLKKVGDD